MPGLRKDIDAAVAVLMAGSALIGIALAFGIMALVGAPGAKAESSARTYVPCIEAGMTAPQDRSADPRVLACPPAGTSARNPVVVDTGYGNIRLAYFENGSWVDASDTTRRIHAVWSWRWP